jgi:hypothetical protein
LLEVVEEQEQTLVGDLLGQTVLGAEHLPCCLKHQSRVTQGRERHPKDTVRVAPRGFGGHLQPEARLACAAGARQREQPDFVLGQQLEHLRQLVLPADERSGSDRQVGPIEAFQWRELVVAELIDPFRRRQVLQPVVAQVLQSNGAHQTCRGFRHQHLTAVSGRRNARRPMHIQSDIPLPTQQRRPGVDTHANPDRAPCQSGPADGRGLKSTRSRRKSGEKSIPL